MAFKFKIPFGFGKKKDQDIDQFGDQPYVFNSQWGETLGENVIKAANQVLLADGEPDVTATDPEFDIKQFEVLLESIYTHRVAERADLGDFVIPSIILHHNEDGDELNFENVTLSLKPKFQNVTKLVVDAIFNSSAYIAVPYEDKFKFATSFEEAYQKIMGVGPDDVATIPTAEEVERFNTQDQPIDSQVPNLASDDYGNFGASGEIDGDNDYADSYDYGDSVGDDPDKDYSAPEPVQPAVTPSIATNDTSATMSNPAPVVNNTNVLDDQSAVADVAKGLASEVMSNYPIVFPSFETADLKPKAPEEAGFVEYKLNQDKLHFNQEIAKRQQVYRDQFKAKLVALQQKATTDLNNNVANFVKENDHRSDLKGQVEEEFKVQRDKEVSTEKQRLESIHDASTKEENQRHESELAKIDRTRDDALNSAKNDIDRRINMEINQELAKRTNIATRDLLKDRENFIQEQRDSQQADFEKWGAEESQALNEYGSRLMAKARKIIDHNSNVYVNNHNNAMQAKAAETRADNESKRINTDFAKNNQVEKDLSNAKAEIAQLKTENGNLKGQLATATSSTNSKNMQDLLTTLAISNSNKQPVQQPNDQTPALLKAFLESQNKNNQTPAPVEKNNNQGLIVGGVASVVIALMLGMGGMFISSQNNKIDQMQAQTTQMAQTVKDTKSANAKLSDDLETAQAKEQEAENKAAQASSQKQDDKKDDNKKDDNKPTKTSFVPNKTHRASDNSEGTL